MLTNSLSYSKKSFNRNIQRKKCFCSPKKIHIKKLLIEKSPLNNSLKDNLPYINNTLTPKIKIKKRILSPLKKSNFQNPEEYLISTSLLSKNENSNEISFNLSYFKNLSNKYSPILSKRGIESKELTNNIKKACKQNILINILKNKREEISKTEKLIQIYFIEYKRQIDKDFYNFNRISNEYFAMKRKENKILEYYKLIYRRAKREYILETMTNKKLRDTIEKVIRDIYKLKEYANFIHTMYGIPFIMDKINENLLYENKFDNLREELIKLYTEQELKKEDEKRDKLLKNINLFMKNFILYENNIIHLLKDQNNITKDIYYIKIDNKNRLKNLVRVKNDYIDNKNILKKINQNFKNELESTAGLSKNDLYEDVIKYILQFINIFNLKLLINTKKDSEIEYYNYCKEIVNSLKEKEDFIDRNIKEINKILNNGNQKDKDLMERIITERKKINKRKLQKYTQENLLKQLELNKLKLIEKNGKKVVKGRAILDYKYISLHSDDEKKRELLLIEKENKAKNEFNLEYCLSEYNNNI